MHRLTTIAVLASTSILFGCDSGGSSTSTSSTSTGQFIDNPVQGLSYATATQTGTTNENGEYKYVAGETVTFSIGGIQFPAVSAKGTVTPLDVFSTDNINATAVVNMLRLLQTIDQDGDLKNGITISQAAIDAAAGLNVDFASADFDSQVDNLVKNSGSPTTSLISADEATQHFRGALPFSTSDLAGVWFAGALATPVFGTANANDFEAFAYKLDVDDAGGATVTDIPQGNTPPASGNLVLTTSGDDRGLISSQGTLFNAAALGGSKDFVVAYFQENSQQELSLAVKARNAISLADTEGTWQSLILKTPDMGSIDATEFAYFFEDFIVDSSGSVDLNVIAAADEQPGFEDNEYQISIDTLGGFSVVKATSMADPQDTLTFAMNAAKSAMISVAVDDTSNEISLLLRKAASYSQSDLEGTWLGGTIITPAYQTNDANDFDFYIGRVDIDAAGVGSIDEVNPLDSNKDDVYGINFSVDSKGNVTTTNPNGSPESVTRYWAMDDTKTIVGVITVDTANDAQYLSVYVKQQ